MESTSAPAAAAGPAGLGGATQPARTSGVVRLEADTVLLDNRSGARGTVADWVAAFTRLWSGGRSELDRFMDIFGPEIRLIAPGLRSTTGWAAGREAFRQAFDVMPDLTGSVKRWSASGAVLFVEMSFTATVGGTRLTWPNVDRFLFVDGRAVERVAYFNPLKVRRALLRSPRGWLQMARLVRHRH